MRRPQSRDPHVWDSQLRNAGGSLFERLKADEEDMAPPRDLDALNAKVRSIKRHLVKLLNARAGGSASAPDLGLVDFNVSNVESNDLTQHIAASIRTCIESFEPRVKVHSIEFVKDMDRPLNLQFKVVTALPVGHRNERVQIDVMMRDGRLAQVL